MVDQQLSSPADRGAEVTCEAFSKVLLTGGYLITEAPNRGIVLQTDCALRCTARPRVEPTLLMRSDQFHYEFRYEGHRRMEPEPPNVLDKLVYFAVAYLGIDLSYTEFQFVSDNSFFSQRNSGYFPDKLDEQPLRQEPPDCAAKTGLGSSAALIVAFMKALAHYYKLKISGTAMHAHC